MHIVIPDDYQDAVRQLARSDGILDGRRFDQPRIKIGIVDEEAFAP